MKRIIFLFLTIIIIIVMIVRFSNFETKNDTSLKNSNENNSLSIMFQDEKGKYQEGDNSFNKEGYHFNSKRSKCLNGNKIKYQDNELLVSGTKSDRCYAYFDNNSFVEDLSGNGNNGINNGAIWQKDGLLLGDENQIYGYVNCGLKNYDFKNSVSFVIRFKPNKNTSYMHLMSNHEGAGWALIIRYDQIIYSLFISERGTYVEPKSESNIIKVGETYILIGTYDGQEVKIYLDGIEVASTKAEGNVKPSPEPILIGGNPFSGTLESSPANILLQEALIFDRALTEEEIAQDYTSKINPTNKEDLLLWYKF